MIWIVGINLYKEPLNRPRFLNICEYQALAWKNIEEIIRDVIGVPLKIKCKQAEVQSTSTNNGANGSSYVEKLGQKIPLIKTIIDEFDGELVK